MTPDEIRAWAEAGAAVVAALGIAGICIAVAVAIIRADRQDERTVGRIWREPEAKDPKVVKLRRPR